MEQQAMELIASKLESALKSKGYSLSWAESEEAGIAPRYALLCGKETAYGVFYGTDKKQVILRVCAVSINEPDNHWANVSIWMFDPEKDELRDAESIANDFIESIIGSASVSITRTKKRVRKDDENNVDPIFFINRFVTVFPELKEALAEHRFYHTDILPVYFIREKVAPKIIEAWSNRYQGGVDSKLSDRLFSLINDNYKNGDLDTKSIITQVILNSIQDPELESSVEAKLDDQLRRIWAAGRKYRDKPAKPEKPPQKGGIIARMNSDVLGQ